MAMAALARRIDVSRDLEAMPIWSLRELARQQHPEHDERAPRVFVNRLLDMEVERRTVHPSHLGFHQGPLANAGDPPGGTDIAREPLATLYDRGIRGHEAHEAVARWIAWAHLSDRQLLAALIQARKVDRRARGTEWGANYDQIAANLGPYAQQLGFGAVAPVASHTFDCVEDQARTHGTVRVRTPHRVAAFKNGQALKDAAKAGRAQLLLLAKSNADPVV